MPFRDIEDTRSERVPDTLDLGLVEWAHPALSEQGADAPQAFIFGRRGGLARTRRFLALHWRARMR
jgi:hypothetical protein